MSSMPLMTIERTERPGSTRSVGAGRGYRWLVSHARRRCWPAVVSVALVAATMGYSLLWFPVVHHTQIWITPGDVWSTFRAAHWVGWGNIGGVYGGDTQLVTFPGIAVLLAPAAMISGGLGLTESISPIFLNHPTAWLVLGPAIALLGGSCLFGLDAMAEQLGVDRRRRFLLCCMEAAVIFQVIAIWGHPEDVVALGLALYALLASLNARWLHCGLLWGAAIVVQPLVVLMVPLAFSRLPRGHRLEVGLLAASPSVVLLSAPLAMEWRQTSRVFLHQANFQFLDHATPWIALSPHLTRISVGAGPGRMLAVGAAIGLGLWAFRSRPSLVGLVWLCALALSLRCFFESVMVPFYLGPPLALIVLASALRGSWIRLLGAWSVAMVATAFSFHRFSEWGYWAPLVVLLAAGLAAGWPGLEEVGIRKVARPGDDAPMAAGHRSEGERGDGSVAVLERATV